jgi:hypothetical protein
VLIKVDWLPACIALREVRAKLVVVQWHWRNIAASGKQGPISEEMSQTLLTNKKKGNLG